MKDFDKGIIEPMGRISDLMQERYGGAVGQATQMVVGAADESDWDIYNRMASLYGNYGFKRVYYSAFRPVKYTPLEEHPATPPAREHRLYQMDWLSRIYGYDSEELRPAFSDDGFLDTRTDPKLMIAMNNYERFPVGREPGERAGTLACPRCWAVGGKPNHRAAKPAFHHPNTRAQGDGCRDEARPPVPALPRPQAHPCQAGRTPPLPGTARQNPAIKRAMELHTESEANCSTCPLNPGTCGMAA